MPRLNSYLHCLSYDCLLKRNIYIIYIFLLVSGVQSRQLFSFPISYYSIEDFVAKQESIRGEHFSGLEVKQKEPWFDAFKNYVFLENRYINSSCILCKTYKCNSTLYRWHTTYARRKCNPLYLTINLQSS